VDRGAPSRSLRDAAMTRLLWLAGLLAATGCADFSIFEHPIDLGSPGGDGGATRRCAAGGGALLCDDFEGTTIDPSKWLKTTDPSNSIVEIEPQTAGGGALHVVIPAGTVQTAGVVNRRVLVGQTQGYYVRARVKLSLIGFDFLALQLQQGGLTWVVGTQSNGGYYSVNSGDPVIGFHMFGMPVPGEWFCIEWALLFSASGSMQKSEIRIDDKLVESDPITATLSVPDQVTFGITHNAALPQAEAWFDDIIIDTQPIGCL
jgi:hypothetical protein